MVYGLQMSTFTREIEEVYVKVENPTCGLALGNPKRPEVLPRVPKSAMLGGLLEELRDFEMPCPQKPAFPATAAHPSAGFETLTF